MKKRATFELLKTNNSHWYYIRNRDFPEGVEMPSSTNILEVFPNPNLKYWLKNTSPEEIEEKTEKGKNSGSKTHHACYLLSYGEIIDPNQGLTAVQLDKLVIETEDASKRDDDLIKYLSKPFNEREVRCLDGFKNYWEDLKPVTVERELKVYHRQYHYAGTLDWAGYLWNAKKKKYEFWLVDYKISNSHDLGYELQVASYYQALKNMFRKKNLKAKLGLLYLGKTTKKRYQLKEIEDKKKAWNSFLLTKRLWHIIFPNARPDTQVEYDKVSVDTSFKTKGRLINFN